MDDFELSACILAFDESRIIWILLSFMAQLSFWFDDTIYQDFLLFFPFNAEIVLSLDSLVLVSGARHSDDPVTYSCLLIKIKTEASIFEKKQSIYLHHIHLNKETKLN